MRTRRALQTTLEAVDAGTVTPIGFYPRSYPVNAAMRFGTGFTRNLR